MKLKSPYAACALQLAARQYNEDAKQFRDIATTIRAGGEVPMFASGEGGARGAERLAEQFEEQHKDAVELLDRFE